MSENSHIWQNICEQPLIRLNKCFHFLYQHQRNWQKKEIREPWKVSSISNSGQLKMSKRKLKNWGRISILTLEFLFPWERGDLKKNIINPSHVRAGTVSIKSISPLACLSSLGQLSAEFLTLSCLCSKYSGPASHYWDLLRHHKSASTSFP